ncbi:deoxyribonuclease-1-like [Apostichopus japonicus]|uniref:deoxyribonuclease-1-like n=1 Tax=Stichopus japonicus TaxID=307972 RepID=UPI003AB79CA9
MKIFLSIAFVAWCCTISAATNRKIAAFNIQIFGQSKSGKPDVMSDLVQILKRYDITLIQEIRDSAQTAIDVLLDQLNAETGNAYSKVISGRLGRTSSKEQYCFFYKHSLFSVIKDDTFTDTSDIFEREPYSVEFRHTSSGREFVLSGLHAKPDDAVAEIDAMVEVYDDIKSTFSNSDVIMMGDFNADCSYVSSSDWANIDLRHDSRFYWPLGDSVDTTVKSTHCAYDRFVTAGSMTSLSSSPSVYKFDTAMNLVTNDPADVSDHYPIEITVNL